MEDQKRAKAIQEAARFDLMLKYIIISRVFPKQHSKEAEKFTNGINLIQKARLAYLFGIMDEIVKKDLEQMYEIRNEIAHNHKANFAHKDILKRVRKLSMAKDQEVTEKNSYAFYESSVTLYRKQIMGIVFDMILKER